VGHGTINASIVGGYNLNQGFPYTDPESYSYGLGIHPFIKLGVTKIFAPDFTNPSYVDMLDAMYRDGTRVSNNSWGAVTNAYTTDSQLYDSLVRDARRTEPGNQEITVVFSSGNSGAGRLSIPSNAKNVIAVGASENLRTGLDGCRIDSTGGDDIQSIIDFSSGGRTLDGRKKPEIIAPGTHIQGASSQDINYTGSGVCGPPHHPTGQTLYTWSSGTSHSAPAVAGAAALVRQFFQQSTGNPASPAMIKAYLTNSTNYMTGHRANDNLPGDSQGWGLVNLGRALDNVPRMLIDQTQVLTESGRTVTLHGRVADATKPFRVTLAWTDAPGSPVGNPVVNDLDPKVEVGGKTYFGNNFAGQVSVEGGPLDNLNNVESVWAPVATTGEFTVTVTAANISGDGVPGNTDVSDQDFALVVYNARAVEDGGGGGGGNEPVDPPPSVSLRSPLGGERMTVGSMVRILWDASDDKKIESQRVEFSADGVEYNPIALLDGNARSFDWRIPSIPTPFARIKVTVFDGVNLPVSSSNNSPFEIVNGPPDNSPPQVLLDAPNKESIVGGGMTMSIEWRESDNVGVIQRIVELSTDNGDTFQQIISLIAPPSSEAQKYSWQIPIDLASDKAKVRITIYDGAGNSATVTSSGKFVIWPMPIITEVEVKEDDSTGKLELQLSGRNFRDNQTEIYVDGKKLKKIKFEDKFSTGNGTFRKVSSFDKKVKKRVPWHKDVLIVVKLKETGQESPPFSFKRRRTN
jgi:subtilisin family serine protease